MSSSQKVKILLAYDGTPYYGWQRQKTSSQPTVQSTVEGVISKIFDAPVRVIGSSRTDTGVHAWGQVAHFMAPKPLEKYHHLLRSFNGVSPVGLLFRQIWRAPDDFHALASAQAKTYRYLIHNSAFRHPFYPYQTTWESYPLDLSYLNQVSQFVIGTHDFKSFQSSGTPVSTTVRQIHGAVWRRRTAKLMEFSVTGTGFLKQMVRNLVGTMLDLHKKKESPERMKEILAACDRQAALSTAPPHGLYLMKVHYPESLDNRCLRL